MIRKGQVWVETVIYTLIGLTLIGIVLAVVLPKINTSTDQVIIEQSIEALNVFDSKIQEVVEWGSGNVRGIPEFTLKRGSFFVDPSADEIYLIVDDLESPYSEVGLEVKSGRVSILTDENQGVYSVRLSLNYTGVLDLKYDDTEELKKFENAALPYSFFVENSGVDGGVVVINVVES